MSCGERSRRIAEANPEWPQTEVLDLVSTVRPLNTSRNQAPASIYDPCNPKPLRCGCDPRNNCSGVSATLDKEWACPCDDPARQVGRVATVDRPLNKFLDEKVINISQIALGKTGERCGFIYLRDKDAEQVLNLVAVAKPKCCPICYDETVIGSS